MLLLAVMFGPYAVFHLLFQETVTVRYALPLVLPVAYLASVTLVTDARPLAGGLAAAALLAREPEAGGACQLSRTGGSPSPIFRVLDAMRTAATPDPVVAMHRRVWTESRRARSGQADPPGQLAAAPRDYEWLELTRAWRERDVPLRGSSPIRGGPTSR